MENQNYVISIGDKVVLKKDNSLKCCVIDHKTKSCFGKHFSLKGATGHQFGTEWELINNKIALVNKDDHLSLKIEDGAEDNRSIMNGAESQTLKSTDIVRMKEGGATGENIIESLVDNSSSFKNKTIYSKEKYLKKKKSKHLVRFTILQPTTRLVCEVFFSKASPKTLALRMDTLSQILTATNVHSGCNVLVVEHVQGMLVAAVMERLSGNGNVVQLHTEDYPVHHAVDAFSFTEKQREVLHTMFLRQLKLRMSELINQELQVGEVKDTGITCKDMGVKNPTENLEVVEELKERTEILSPGGINLNVNSQLPLQKGSKGEECVTSSEKDVNEEKMKSGIKRKHESNNRTENKALKRQKEDRILEILMKQNLDCLLIASRCDPTELTGSLLQFLAPGRPFAVFANFKEPLLEAFINLKKRGDVMNVRFTETWLREYQVLPERTHPHVRMNHGGGYLLTGIKIISD